jgi:NAD(P)H-hydrate epimerase
VLKILSVQQVREADAATISKKGISGLQLMEQAGSACCEWLLREMDPAFAFLIICGRGNNGGDGLVIARQLWHKGKIIHVVVVEQAGNGSRDFTTNLDRLQQECAISPLYIRSAAELNLPEGPFVVVDALFGSGLSRKLEGDLADIVRKINASGVPVISIDIPSGMPGDQAAEEKDAVIKASTTLTFGVVKPAFVLDRNTSCTGTWHLLDIGLDDGFIQSCETHWFMLEPADIATMLPQRQIAAHKGNFGHALLLAGSYGKAGAAILAAKACMRSGTGLVTVRIPSPCVDAIQSSVPEAMVSPDPGPATLNEGFDCTVYSAVGVGPGIGIDPQTGNVLKRIIQDFGGPIVLDADALNLLAMNRTWLSFLPHGSLLTPHPGEFARLAGKIEDPLERIQTAQDWSKRYGIYILLKGRYSALSCPDGQVIFNCSGNNGMARGGAGDALTGMITGLAAQGLPMFRAALCGMYLHGLAGDLAAEAQTAHAMSISDLIECIPAAFRETLQP